MRESVRECVSSTCDKAVGSERKSGVEVDENESQFVSFFVWSLTSWTSVSLLKCQHRKNPITKLIKENWKKQREMRFKHYIEIGLLN